MSAVDTQQLKEQWLERLDTLFKSVSEWVDQNDGWSIRLIEKNLVDSEIGKHKVPALMLQKDITRILFEPIARSAPGADGVVDMYLLPAYDDIASLYHDENGWQLHYMFSGQATSNTIREAESVPLSEETLKYVIEEMVRNAD